MKPGIALYDALLSIEVPADKARDVVNALEDDMQNLATKQDLDHLEQRLEQRMTSALYRALLIQTMALAGLMVAIVKLL